MNQSIKDTFIVSNKKIDFRAESNDKEYREISRLDIVNELFILNTRIMYNEYVVNLDN